MKTIYDFLTNTRIVEFLAPDSDPMYRDFVKFLKAEMPTAEFVPVRSISADVFGVNFRGIDHIIWDETHVGAVLSLAAALLSENAGLYQSVVRSYALQIMADLLFDEGLYIDAWIAASTGNSGVNTFLPNSLQEEISAENIRSGMVVMLAFLYLHEAGHLLHSHRPDVYGPLHQAVDADVRRYSGYLRRMPRHERDAMLGGAGFLVEVRDGKDSGPDGDRLSLLELLRRGVQRARDIVARRRGVALEEADTLVRPPPDLIEEGIADLYAMLQIFREQVDSAHRAIDVAEAILALRLAMEMVREVRVTTRFLAVEKRAKPAQSTPEGVRGLVLRQAVLYSALEFAESAEERGNIGAEVLARYNRLLKHKSELFDGVPDMLVNFGLEEARLFRAKMQAVQAMFKTGADTESRYFHSYLRLRRWQAPDGDIDENLLDTLPEITSLATSTIIRRLVEKFAITPTRGGKINLSLRRDAPTDKSQ